VLPEKQKTENRIQNFRSRCVGSDILSDGLTADKVLQNGCFLFSVIPSFPYPFCPVYTVTTPIERGLASQFRNWHWRKSSSIALPLGKLSIVPAK
jgi:hypothetical protein